MAVDPGGTSEAGTITKPVLRARRVVPESGDATGEKSDPALMVPQLRQLLAGLIEDHLKVNETLSLCRRSTRWLRRNEQTRLYHHAHVK